MNLPKRILCIIGGAVAGVLAAYLFAARSAGAHGKRVTIVEKKGTEPAVALQKVAEHEEVKRRMHSEKVIAEAKPEGPSAEAEHDEKPQSATQSNGRGSFDRFHGWSRWSPHKDAYDVHHRVESVEACEELCLRDDECHSSTLIAQTCGLFHNDGDAQNLVGETNLSAVTSVRLPSSEGRDPRTCHGPVATVPGMPNERPASAPCYSSSENAVAATLKNAQPLVIFAPMFNAPKKDAF